MGDARYQSAFRRVADASDPPGVMASMRTRELIEALGAASREADPYMANVLATALLNREAQARATGAAQALAAVLLSSLASLGAATLLLAPRNFADSLIFIGLIAFVALLLVVALARLATLSRGAAGPSPRPRAPRAP